MKNPCVECGDQPPGTAGGWGLCPNCYGRRRYNNLPMPGEDQVALDLPGEEWRPVIGFEDVLEVSSLGRVRSPERTITNALGRVVRYRARLRKQWVREWGRYPYVVIRRQGKTHYLWVARLVAQAFLGPKPEGQVLRHLDDVKTNNAVSNLAYGTESQNAYDRVRNGGEPKTRRTHCPRNHPLAEPNITSRERREGRRSCLACARAQSYIRTHQLDPHDLQEISDQYYERIMAGLTGRWIRRLEVPTP